MFVASRSRPSWSLYALLLGSLLHLSSPQSAADDFYWINPTGGVASDPENWNPEGAPGDGDVAIFDLGTTGYEFLGNFLNGVPEIQVNNDELIYYSPVSFDVERFSIGHAAGSVGTVTVDAFDLMINNSDPASPDGGLWVGEHGNGTLDISSSAFVNVVGQIVVGDGEEAVGTIIVDSTEIGDLGLTDGNHLLSTTIARHGTGTLSATNRSAVSLTGTFVVGQEAGSLGTVTVDNSLLGWTGFSIAALTSTTIGAAGMGSLSATDGSGVVLTGTSVVGQYSGSQGVITVDDSILRGYGLTTIGAAGMGSLAVADRSQVEFSGTFVDGEPVGSLVVGEEDGSRGVVTVDDSELSIYVPTTIGAAGTGSLAASNTSFVEIVGPIVGLEAGSQGEVSIDASELTGYSPTIGAAGTGSLAATNRSRVTIVDTFVVGKEDGSHGLITIDDSDFISRELNSTSFSSSIGVSGTGSLSVMNRSMWDLEGTLVVGQEVGSQGTVTVDASQLYGRGLSSATIGAAGVGSLSVMNGSDVEFGDVLVVGQEVGSQGTVTFDASEFFGNGLRVGLAGTGSFAATNGSQLDFRGRLFIGQEVGSHGEVTIDNSFLVARDIYVGGTNSDEGGSGTLSFTGGAEADLGYVQIWPTGSIEIDSSTVQAFQVVNNGVVHVNGILDGPLDNEMGGVLSGTGTILENVRLKAGSQIIPGNSPGSLTLETTRWEGDATFRFMINRAEGDAGSDPGWNSMHALGFLSLQGSPNDPMRVSLMSLLPDNEAGDVFDFNPAKSYLWTFATATNGIFNFSPESFVVDTTDFSNPIGSGYFEVRQIGNSLAVAFVPEPSALMLAAIGGVSLLVWTRRKR